MNKHTRCMFGVSVSKVTSYSDIHELLPIAVRITLMVRYFYSLTDKS